MTNEKEYRLRIDQIKLERFKEWRKIITVTITVLIGTFGVAYINHVLQNKQLDQQRLLNDAQLRQNEMKYLGNFLDYALAEDIKKRIRFAEYFSALTISDDLRDKWGVYHANLVDLDTATQKIEKDLADALKAGDIEKARTLEQEVARKQEQVQAIPEKSDVEITQNEILMLLDEDMKPLRYIDNKFEEKTIKGKKVVLDVATGLMWQQSGSKEYMSYDEANVYIEQLNNKQFAGHSDWRLPTLKEAITLLEQTKKNEDLYIDPLFDQNQDQIWTSDLFSNSLAWRLQRRGGGTPSALVVRFNSGKCGIRFIVLSSTTYIRAVR